MSTKPVNNGLQPAKSRPLQILDPITTAQGAKRLLEYRVSCIDADPRFINYLVCPEDPYFTDGFKEKGIKFIPFPMQRGLNPLSVIAETWRFLTLLHRIKPDIVHAHTSKAGAISRIACTLYSIGKKDKPFVCYQVHSFYFNALSGFKRNIFLGFERFLSRLSDALLFQNEEELEQARANGMGKKAHLVNIGNGIRLDEFGGKKTVRSLPAWQDKSSLPLSIVCVARIEAKKNHRMLLDAALHLKELIAEKYGEACAQKAFVIDCIGEIGMPEIINYAHSKGAEALVRFCGVKNREELSAIFNAAHISVLTSTAEGKPRALMESMAAGIPCVATDVCGTRDVISDGMDGFLVPLNESGLFAEALFSLMEDSALYTRFSGNCLEKARNEFDENLVIKRLKKLYLENTQAISL